MQNVQEREVYVGPRPFERSERNLFFGRDREISELLSLVTSSRVVLCYAPSGAGKTSLINAGLQPRLEKEGFEVLPSTRVRGLIPDGIDPQKITNLYMFNALLSLAGETQEPAELTDCSMAKFLSTLPHQTDEEDFSSPRILIFDQFEELITSYPELWQEREGFFQQVSEALQADSLLRVLFIMREDFLARIEPFTRLLKPLSQSRFRLDLLGPTGAEAAVTGPLQGTGKRFKEGVVASLIEELLKVRVETAQGEATEVVGEYVEPVQLQVVCRNLWTSLPPDVKEISPEHLKAYGDVDQALRDFYESCLTEAKVSLRANEPNLREWFEHQLITPAGTRGIVFRDAKLTAGLPNAVVDFLENQHLIRGEWRAGSRWYELTHDRFIEPIQRANERWQARRQTRTNRLLASVGGVVMLGLVLISVILSFQKSAVTSTGNYSTSVAAQTSVSVNATSVVAAQSTASVAQEQITVAQEDVSLAKSRQLAAQALLVDDPNLALLLAVGANQNADTQEARRSLHKILSRQAVIDGNFLRELNPEIIAPTLINRLVDHRGPVVSVAFSPDGKRFVSGSDNGTVLLWDVATAQPIRPSLTTQSISIASVAYSPDGLLIASAGQDEEISLWDASTGEPVGIPLRGHTGLVTCLAFSPDGKLLASGGVDFHVRIWDVANQRLVDELKHDGSISSLAWSPNGELLAVGTLNHSVSFWQGNDAHPFDYVNEISGLNSPVQSIAWSQDGTVLAFGMASEEGRPESGGVLLWDYANRQSTGHPLQNNNQNVRSVAFDLSGKTLAIGRDDGTIVFWDTRTQQVLGSQLAAHDHRVMSIVFSPDGQYMVSGSFDGTVALWNLLAPTRSIAVTSNGDMLATSQGSVISLWDLSSDRASPVKILSGHTDDILALAFSPDGNTLVSSGKDKDKTVRFWDVHLGHQSGVALPTQSNVLTLQFSPDGSTLAVAGENGRVQLLDIVTGNLNTLMERGSPILKVQFRQDGKTLQAATKDGHLFTWDLKSSEATEAILPDVQGAITSLALSQDGQKSAYFQEGGIGETTTQKGDGRAHGIDIYSGDQFFDPTANPDDIDFIIIKATEGTQSVEPLFEGYLKQIQSVPMRGVYHFFRENQAWQEQADLFLSTVKDKGFHFYVLVLDVDPGADKTQFLADAEQWLKYVDENVEGRVLLYAGSNYLSKFGPAADWMKEWPLWIAQYPFKPNRNGTPDLPEGFVDWKIWQYTEKGGNAEYGVGSTKGNHVDLNVYNGTPSEMGAWLGFSTFSIYDKSSNKLTHPKQAIRVTSPNGIAFSPDGIYLATADEGTVSLLDAASGEEISTLSIGGRNILSLNFMPDASALAVGTDDGAVLLWDLSLLQSGTDAEPTLKLACSRVNPDFPDSDLLPYLGEVTKRDMCEDLP